MIERPMYRRNAERADGGSATNTFGDTDEREHAKLAMILAALEDDGELDPNPFPNHNPE